MPAIKDGWSETSSLPIMPNGAIPPTSDLVRTPQGYIVKPGSAAKYDAPAGSEGLLWGRQLNGSFFPN